MNQPLRVLPVPVILLVVFAAPHPAAHAAAPNGVVYWVDGQSQLGTVNLDGTGFQVLLNNLGGPMSVDVDPFGQKVYWTEYNTRKIRRANLDGSNVQDVVTNFLGTYTAPRGISLDLTNSKIYWTFDVVQHTGPQTYYPGAASANMFDGSNP
jgi:Low-density lipoprotein receptor repeat class B